MLWYQRRTRILFDIFHSSPDNLLLISTVYCDEIRASSFCIYLRFPSLARDSTLDSIRFKWKTIEKRKLSWQSSVVSSNDWWFLKANQCFVLFSVQIVEIAIDDFLPVADGCAVFLSLSLSCSLLLSISLLDERKTEPRVSSIAE